MHNPQNATSYGTSPDGFIPTLAIAEFLKDAHKILIVGDFTKRDHDLLKTLNKNVTVIDITPLSGIDQFYLQSITTKTPFEDNHFDGVIMAEVIEHLFEDHAALDEIHRILSPHGKLIITVPYFSNKQDEPEYHVRIHSKKTITRLLGNSGFNIKSHFYRGIMSRLPQKNRVTKTITFGISKLLRLTFGRNKGLYYFQKLWFSLEKFLGSNRFFLPLQRTCISFGGIMVATKSTKVDFMQIQKDSFIPPEVEKREPNTL
ncbi:hypothetical protein COB28_01700 [Candidatus Dependentiae bacterium]|nr:MAG: hypothetical protein COB28_01700 [Candidatus Dependentiae bacterium]